MFSIYFTQIPTTLTELLGLKYDNTMSYEERVQKRYEYVKTELEKNDRFEAWDYLENVKFGLKFDHLVTFNYLISTKGRILTLFKQEGKYRVLGAKTVNTGYKEQTLSIDKRPYGTRIHRALACTFIPKPPDQKRKVNRLVVNHLDLNKLHNFIANLEWCTNAENVRHELDNGTRGLNSFSNRSVKGTVLIDCVYKGHVFKLDKLSDLTEGGVCAGFVYSVLVGASKTGLGCDWELISKEEAGALPTIPSFILNKMLTDLPYLNLTIKPLKGTIVKEGKYQGTVFVTYGKKELMTAGFNQGNVSINLLSNKRTQGCLFEYVSRDEAETLQRGLTQEQMDLLNLKSKLK